MNHVNEDIANIILAQTYRNILLLLLLLLLLGIKYVVISITENYKMTSVRIQDLFNFFSNTINIFEKSSIEYFYTHF
jgi:hypothetical protein